MARVYFFRGHICYIITPLERHKLPQRCGKFVTVRKKKKKHFNLGNQWDFLGPLLWSLWNICRESFCSHLKVSWGKVQTDSVTLHVVQIWINSENSNRGQSQLHTPSSVTDRYLQSFSKTWDCFTQTANLNINILKGQSSKEMKRESKSPDSLIKTPNFVSCCFGGNFINFVKCCF